MNTPRHPLPPKDLPSGPGKVLTSSGAEDFDPDSMLDEEVFSQPSSVSRIPTSRPFLALTLIPPLDNVLWQVAGLLHKGMSEETTLGLTFECLTEYALRLSELALSRIPTGLSKVEYKTVSGETSLELPGYVLTNVHILDIQGAKALVAVTFRQAAT